MKRIIISMLVVFIAVVILPVAGFAADDAIEDCDMVDSKTFTEKEIARELVSLGVVELEKLGYSFDQINEIKAIADGREETYGKVKYEINYKDYSYSKKKDKTYITTIMTWSWSEKPRMGLTDIAATNIRKSFFARTDSNGVVLEDAHVNYYKYGKKTKENKLVIEKDIKVPSSFKGSYIKFNMIMKKNGYEYVALGGAVTTKWVSEGKRTVVPMGAKYGHSVITCSPSVIFESKGIGISFKPGVKCVSGDLAYLNAEL